MIFRENIHPWQVQHSKWTVTDIKHQRTFDNILCDHNVLDRDLLIPKEMIVLNQSQLVQALNITRLAKEQFIQGITFMTGFPTVKHKAAILNTDLFNFKIFWNYFQDIF